MFSFAGSKDARFRMDSHRHNPYVGSFHCIKSKPSLSSMHLDTSLNPFIGHFRHSPCTSINVGLKGILWEPEPWNTPICSQIKLSREKQYSNRHISPQFLACIPTSIFKCPIDTSAFHVLPTICGICFECFEEDDELRPLPCGHSFHRGCIDDWLLGLKSDIKAYTRNCPCCRQDISLPSLSRSASIASSIDTSTLTTVNSQEISERVDKNEEHVSPLQNEIAHPHQSQTQGQFQGEDLLESSFSFSDNEEDASPRSSPTPTYCGIPRDSFLRIGEWLSVEDIGTSNTLSERFNVDDEEDTDSDDYHHDNDNGNDPSTASQDQESNSVGDPQHPCLFSISKDKENQDDDSTDGDGDGLFLELCDDVSDISNHKQVGKLKKERNDKNDLISIAMSKVLRMRENSQDEDEDIEEDEDSSDHILSPCRMSDISICTATNNALVPARKYPWEGAEDNQLEVELDVSGSESVCSPYFRPLTPGHMSLSSFIGLGGSLYSDCGVPLLVGQSSVPVAAQSEEGLVLPVSEEV